MELILGDSREILKTFPENVFDSCITDPPYELTSITKRFGAKNSAPAKEGTDGRFSRLSKGFMGHEWDGSGIQRDPEFWAEVLRVLKPGAFLLSFGGTRTYHRTACAIEDAGFNIRDTLSWLYGQGFPKSHDLGNGWGTNLKPAWEPIIMAQKPKSEKTILANMIRWGVGGINIDASRIAIGSEIVPINKLESWSGFGQEVRPDYEQEINTKGRWPSNLILDEESAELLDNQSGVDVGTGVMKRLNRKRKGFMLSGSENNIQEANSPDSYGDSGGASRFFYVAKATKKEKEVNGKSHPTSKPVALITYMVQLVTPQGGFVLDPFLGGGTTGVACKNLGCDFMGIDIVPEYIALAKERLNV